MALHTSGEWRRGKPGGCVVSDTKVRELTEGEELHYGGHLIAESIAECNIPIIAAAPDLLLKLKRLYRAYCASRPLAEADGVAIDALEAIMKAESW